VPAHLTGETGQHAKHAVVFGKNPANRRSGIDAKQMEFAEKEKSEGLIQVRARHNHIANR
jgi:hypothetical protein